MAPEPRCELLYGSLWFFPAPPPSHDAAVAALLARLEEAARHCGGLVAHTTPTVLADHSVTVPDLAYLSPVWRHLAREWIEGPPDLVVELLSPGTAQRDRGEELALYAESGVREIWLVDPDARTFEVRLAGERLSLPGRLYRTVLLPGFALDLSTLWHEVEARVRASDDRP